MKKLLIAFIVLGAVAFAIPNAANASPLPGWSGTLSLTGTSSLWTADIIFDVYAPSAGGLPGGLTFVNDYAYFYRVDNVVSAGGSAIKHLTVGNPFKAPIVTVNYTDYLAGRDPVNYGNSGDSIGWNWEVFGLGSNPINPGEHSDWCYYTSPKAPVWVTGSLQNGGAAIGGNVPGPAPEPGTMAMLGLGLVGFAGRVIRRKFNA